MKLTGFVVLAAILLVAGYDLFRVMHDGNYTNTVSQWMYRTSKEFMIIPFLFGVAAGHFWWPLAGGHD